VIIPIILRKYIMAIVMLHHFPVEDFYKISYTGKDSVEDFEKQQKQWLGQDYRLVWYREFASIDTAKNLKKTYSKGLEKYQSSFIKSNLDTFKSDAPPEPSEVQESEVKQTYVHLVKFIYNEETLYKVGYSTYRAVAKYSRLTSMEVIWDVPVIEGESVAKEFVSFVLGKYPKVPISISYVGRGLVIEGTPPGVKELKQEWVSSKSEVF
jgi:hypothetical protein